MSGLLLVVTTGCAAVTGWFGVPALPDPERRLAAIAGVGSPGAQARGGHDDLLSRPAVRIGACASAATGVGVLLGGARGWALALLVLVLSQAVVSRLEPAERRRRFHDAVRDAPAAADLFAACLAGGSDPARAAVAIGAALGGDLGRALRAVAATVALGADQDVAWRSAAAQVPALGPLARAVARSSATGAPLAEVVALLADQQREERRLVGELAARKVGVRVAGPLGLCFLPAFVLVGVVPVVAGIAGGVLR